MSFNTANLEAILQESRDCFLSEDAPDYLAILEAGMQRLRSGKKIANPQAEYVSLMRAAHSIKGGAGLAELPTLSHLAHQLEDLLEGLHQGRVPASEQAVAGELICLGVEQIQDAIAAAIGGKPELDVEQIPICSALKSFLASLPQQPASSDVFASTNPTAPLSPNLATNVSINPFLLKTALEIDLEDCLQTVERSGEKRFALANLVEECSLLGQTLSLTWLVDAAEALKQLLAEDSIPLEELATTAIAQIRQLREQALNPASPALPEPPVAEPAVSLPQPPIEVEPESKAIVEDRPSTASEQNALSLNLRIPVAKLDRMGNSIGELLIEHERLRLYQTQLHQANLTLKTQTSRMQPIQQAVQQFYDRLATQQPLLGSNFNSSFPVNEFDTLEFDRYTELHSTLQDFQELMVRVDETRTDIELIARELQGGLEQLRSQLDSLRTDLTDSRLVPFSLLAERFLSTLEKLNERYNKNVKLEIVGKDTPIDRAIIEQLQTPLIHLIRNAFDHGIETSEERLLLDKTEAARITLSLVVQGDVAIFSVADNGRGIDCQKVYQKALESGLINSEWLFSTDNLTKDEILELLFKSGFSTAKEVTDISGRGVGLDVVRSQIERLQGKVAIKTQVGQGTTFTITIPLRMSILPLLLCRCQQRTFAIPSSNVLEIIALAEYLDDRNWQSTRITWRDRPIPLFSLIKLLSYNQPEVAAAADTLHRRLGIVLDVDGKQIVVAVDSLLGERELVLKPFDPIIPAPNYLAGCTVLGTGEVVPIISPHNFDKIIDRHQQTKLSELDLLNNDGAISEFDDRSTILIVDDSIGVRRLLNRVLSEAGYQVVECRDGKEALDEINSTQRRFDLIISDIEMPRLDGFGLVKEVRNHQRWYNIPIMMLTSRENNRHRQKAMSLGATDYLTKPFHPVELLKAIASLLSKENVGV
jgi:type IV pili sensor histidine kinase/response regulator